MLLKDATGMVSTDLLVKQSTPDDWEVDTDANRLCHLTSSKMLEVKLSLPNDSAPSSNVQSSSRVRRTEYSTEHGRAEASEWSHGPKVVGGDSIVYFPRPTETASSCKESIDRVLHCTSMAEAIAKWDAEPLKQFVDLLDLEIVPMHDAYTKHRKTPADDVLQPSMHIVQTIEYECKTSTPAQLPRRRLTWSGVGQYLRSFHPHVEIHIEWIGVREWVRINRTALGSTVVRLGNWIKG